MSTDYNFTTPFVSLDDAEGKTKELLSGAKEDMGFVPNMFEAMAIAPPLLSTYMHGYQAFREESPFSPPEQEVILLTISRIHGCMYCMSAHSMIADKMSDVSEPVQEALREGKSLPDEKLDALATFTQVMVESRGMPSEGDVKAFLDAGYKEEHILHIILAIAVKTMSNYNNHITKTKVDDAFKDYLWKG